MRTDKPHCPKCGRIKYEDVIVDFVNTEPPTGGTASIRTALAKRTCRTCGSEIYY